MLYRTEYDLLSTGQAEQALNRAWHMSYEYGDKAGKALAQHLRQSSPCHLISQFNSDLGPVSDPKDLNEQLSKFYSDLYSSESPLDPNRNDSFLDGLTIPSVDQQSTAMLDDAITSDEISLAIIPTQSGKSPGPDGLPTEFFMKYSPKLSPLLAAMPSDSYNSTCLPPTLRKASISLLLKKGKDPLSCLSYRPISLLYVDCKILAKVLARRLESVLASLISPDQTGFI